jgi:CRISPR-associated protein Csx10
MGDIVNLALHVTFESDWHVGEGAGQPGHIDRIVRRDPFDNLPYVPAKTLTGIWRDACEQVALGLDNNVEGSWCRWVDALFGGTDFKGHKSPVPARRAPRTACVSVRPAYFPPVVRTELRKYPALAEALTFIKPGVALDKYKGVAKEDFLRFEEMVLAGAVLESKVSLELPSDADRNCALALLWAGARVVERLGGKRRRGYGRCKLSVGNLPKDEELLKTLNTDASEAPSRSAPDCYEFKTAGAQPAANWQVVTLDITLLTPVVSYAGTVGNVVESLDYLPGTQLLGALNPRLRELLGPDAFSSVARGDVRVLNAYPAMQNQRGLPVPMALHHVKESPHGDQSVPAANFLYGEPSDGVQRKQYRVGYVRSAAKDAAVLELCKVNFQSTTHATIDDRVQRPTTDVGGVYTYQAIRAGTKFRSELWIRGGLATDLESKVGILSDEYRIGTAKKDDYGLIKIEAELDQTPRPAPSTGQTLTLWLVSPLLLRDPYLRPVAGPDAVRGELEARFKKDGLNVTLQEISANGVSPLFARTHRDEGFQRSWGLPRASRVGLAAGSVLRWTVTSGLLDYTELASLQAEGLGERRAEGYGEIVINSALLGKQSLCVKGVSADTDSPFATSAAAQVNTADFVPFQKALVRRAWRTSIRRKALAKAVDETFRIGTLGWSGGKPENSQLGSLRGQLEALTTDNFSELNNWLDRLKSKTDRCNKWPPKAQNALEKLQSKPEVAWEWLEVDDIAAYPALSGVDRENMKNELTYEAVRTLWMAAIHAELKRRTRSGAESETQKETVHG